jgi:hypothetical protein
VERDLIRKFFLRANPNPNREGCPGAVVLKAIAENSLPPNDPARLHLASCSPCFIEFRSLKESSDRAKRRRLYTSLAIAASILIAAVVGFGVTSYIGHRAPAAEMAVVNRTLDLWDRGATRGVDQEHVDGEMNLPKRIVKLQVVLPRLSESGRYTIGIARTKTERNLVQATGPSVTSGRKEMVTVVLDLRSAESGVYFLTTTHEQDEASYYYPVKVG